MAQLVYSAITSLDGYINDRDGNFDWGLPDPEVFEFINQLERGVGTALYGRRMYETMVYWETFDGSEDSAPYLLDYAEIWRSATKIVYSRSLSELSSANTRMERVFDVATVRQLKEATERDLSIGGANLAGQAFTAGLVDEMHLFITPATVGRGTSVYPEVGPSRLELLDVDRYESGVVHLHYRVVG